MLYISFSWDSALFCSRLQRLLLQFSSISCSWSNQMLMRVLCLGDYWWIIFFDATEFIHQEALVHHFLKIIRHSCTNLMSFLGVTCNLSTNLAISCSFCRHIVLHVGDYSGVMQTFTSSFTLFPWSGDLWCALLQVLGLRLSFFEPSLPNVLGKESSLQTGWVVELINNFQEFRASLGPWIEEICSVS